jgi:hypothetical protein
MKPAVHLKIHWLISIYIGADNAIRMLKWKKCSEYFGKILYKKTSYKTHNYKRLFP